MELIKAIVLGFIQGVTEFLPVSSSGHLVIFKNIMDMDAVGITFDILLHLGTLIAVCIVYWRDIFKIIKAGLGILEDSFVNVYSFIRLKLFHERPRYRKIIKSSYRKFTMLVIVSAIPTGIIGALGRNLIENASQTLLIPGFCFLITGTLLMISDKLTDGVKTPKNTTYVNAIFVGFCQGFAILPGISRLGATITAEFACGFRRDFAVKYSFIMSVPVILGATAFDFKNISSCAVSGLDVFGCIIGMLVAAVTGYVCIKTMLVVVRNKKFKYFAYYCYAVGVISVIWSICGMI